MAVQGFHVRLVLCPVPIPAMNSSRLPIVPLNCDADNPNIGQWCQLLGSFMPRSLSVGRGARKFNGPAQAIGILVSPPVSRSLTAEYA